MTMHASPHAFARNAELIDAPTLSPLEWTVVRLAMREVSITGGDAGACPPTPFQRVARALGATLFGWNYSQPLADSRLETLRRFVFAVRRDPRRVDPLAENLLQLGFSPAQVRTVRLYAIR